MGTEYGKYSAWEQSTENIVHGNSVRKNGSEVQRREFSEWNQRKKLGEEGLIRRRKAGEQSSKK